MTWTLLADQPAAPAPGPDGGAAPFGGPNLMFLMFGVLALFWVFIVLPGSRRQKKDKETLEKSLKRGSKVVTSSGIIGTIVSVKEGEDEMVLRSEDAKIKMRKSMVVQLLGSDETEAGK